MSALQKALDDGRLDQVSANARSPLHISFAVPDVGPYLLRITEDAPHLDIPADGQKSSGAPVRRVVARICEIPPRAAEYADAPLAEGVPPVVCKRAIGWRPLDLPGLPYAPEIDQREGSPLLPGKLAQQGGPRGSAHL